MLKNNLKKREQHEAVRKSVGWYNFTHKLLEVTGADTTSFLDWIYLNPIAKTKIGGAKYTTMLNEDGIIIDDVIVFHMDEDKYWVSTLYIDELIAWLDAHKGARKVAYREITGETEMYAVQGPKSRELLNTFLAEKIDDLKFFTIRNNKIGNVPVKIARSGYTGELGYEIYVAPQHMKFVETKLAENGKAFGAKQITEIDVIVGTLPGEKGYILMSDIGGTNPFEPDFDGAIDWSKDFIGKEALLKVKAEGPKRQLLGFTVDDATQIEPGTEVKVNGVAVGKVTKFTYGYTTEKSIGYALVERAKAKVGDKATIGGVPAVLTQRVWYDPENRRPLGK